MELNSECGDGVCVAEEREWCECEKGGRRVAVSCGRELRSGDEE